MDDAEYLPKQDESFEIGVLLDKNFKPVEYSEIDYKIDKYYYFLKLIENLEGAISIKNI